MREEKTKCPKCYSNRIVMCAFAKGIINAYECCNCGEVFKLFGEEI
jgi:predicted RNA-binding Zn-ribbon protein involved in translation (DUF1610 family)